MFVKCLVSWWALYVIKCQITILNIWISRNTRNLDIEVLELGAETLTFAPHASEYLATEMFSFWVGEEKLEAN